MPNIDWKIVKGPCRQLIEPNREENKMYYCFRNDNALFFRLEKEEKYFSVTIKVDFIERHHSFAQFGSMITTDSKEWSEASEKYENEQLQNNNDMVLKLGYSDWKQTVIPADTKNMWYRFTCREDPLKFECSADGKKFLRMCVVEMWEKDLWKEEEWTFFGVHACNPEASGFKEIINGIEVMDCSWTVSDGQ